MRKELFLPTPEGEGRLLLLIDVFTTSTHSLEGRTKLAKLDFFLRYPKYLRRALSIRAPDAHLRELPPTEEETIEGRMVRFRYGPWDPAYFALLGSLIGRGLVVPVSGNSGVAYRTTELGAEVAKRLSSTDPWQDTHRRAKLLKRHLNLSGTRLKDFVYAHFPEVTGTTWGENL
jgi:hypothetical protein